MNRLLDPDLSPLPHIPWALKLAYRVAPWDTTNLFVTTLLIRLGPSAVLLSLQRAITVVTEGAGGAALVRPLAYLAGIMVLSELAGALLDYSEGRLWEKLSLGTWRLILDRTTHLTLDQFDNPEVHDLIERSTQYTTGRIFGLFRTAIEVITVTAGAVSALALLWASSFWVALMAVLVALPISWVGVRQGARLHLLNQRQSPGRRFTAYLGGLLSNREAATELRAYQLVPYFLGRWVESFKTRRADHLDVRWAGVKEGWLAALAAGALFAGALTSITYLARQGRVGAADIIVLVGAVRILQGAMTRLAMDVGWVWQNALPAAEFRRFLSLSKVEGPVDQGVPFPAPLAGPIRFENVSFSYPGGAKPVLDGLNLEIQPGEKVALVGENGAGKSTLVKLLLGLYQPSAGRITVGGVDLQSIAPGSLRANLSCIFQDFVRYDMTLFDNVAMGRQGASEAEVAAACHAAGLDEAVAALPKGYENMLGKTFTGGVDLSGGQWQRVAMARAFIRDAQVLVLDEPTAALDPRAELEVFGKFVELVRGKTAVLISHRLGSARLADRVIVLGDGHVIETGSHDELMARGGRYAELFHMQAQWYVDETAPAGEGVQ